MGERSERGGRRGPKTSGRRVLIAKAMPAKERAREGESERDRVRVCVRERGGGREEEGHQDVGRRVLIARA